MKRFITYLFEYEKGKKEKNIGFIRVDIRNAVCRIEIHLHNLYRYQGKGQIFLFVDPENLTGIPIGTMVVSQGRGEAGYMLSVDGVAGSDYRFADVIGVGIRFGDRYYAASSWLDTGVAQIGEGTFMVWEPEENMEESPKPQAVLPTENSTPDETPYIEQQEIRRNSAAVRTEKLDINGIRRLPKRNHYLCNNSFVIHGYLNYHHLMRKEIDEDGVTKSYLGVPGIYERPERMMAMLFGFPEFETEKEFYGAVSPAEQTSDYESAEEHTFTAGTQQGADKSPADDEATMDGEFGYWLCLLDM